MTIMRAVHNTFSSCFCTLCIEPVSTSVFLAISVITFIFLLLFFFFFSSRRRHTRSLCDWSSDVCSSDLQRPRLRRDLEFTHRRVRNVDEIIVCDPVSGGYFRAGELEAALFKLLDGETDRKSVV